MKKFNSLDDLFDYVDYVRNITTDESSMTEIKNFSKISAERIACNESKHLNKLYLTNDEFNQHFLDIREYKINQILD